ncbi:phosphatidate cytidylyltransferase [Keratinibaculum paraultunense]|uniref:Phosphatidate cytidylyltransferase n=1 Tax=Keratinibaculum paraultunense TaxID=1278232 RepID=A0A4R3KWK6_9FIRM|nr:phosphatidate cytidylyltransferase [Keratinibaculum paraultunense]QQY80703.1 phosphatidate cytidylyltransferase [Keratinibaculum paraultunense]TCS89693.1 phosphatidate cytidylyltransferase [Keratinibaculum paraultunense]
MKELFIRTITGIILVLLTVFVAIKGGTIMVFFIFLLSIIGLKEFYDAVECNSVHPIKFIGYMGCLFFLFSWLGVEKFSLLFILYFILIISSIFLVLNEDATLYDISITLFGIVYIPYLFQHILYLEGDIYIWFVFIIAWGTDTFAYIVGSLFGKKKLCPKLSPNKTLEGSIGGILGSVLLTYLYIKILGINLIWKYIILSIIGSIVAQLGDLTASKIKRFSNVKDFGFIIPGHGGVLDRFDSILFTAPLVYYYINYFIL